MADTQGQNDQDNPGDLRKQRDELSNENKALKDRLTALEQDEQLRDAGLAHLSKRQRRTILRELAEEGTEFSGDAAKEVAKELGYKTEPEPTTTTTTTSSTDTPSGDSSGNGQSTTTTDEGEDVDPDDALAALAVMNRARGQSSSTQVKGDFEQEMKGTKSKEELTSLLRSKGPRHGMIHEWDVP